MQISILELPTFERKRTLCIMHQMICKLSSLPPPMDRMPSAEEDKDRNMKEKKRKKEEGVGSYLKTHGLQSSESKVL